MQKRGHTLVRHPAARFRTTRVNRVLAAVLAAALAVGGCASAGPPGRTEGEASPPDVVGGVRFGSLPSATHLGGLTVAGEHADYLRPLASVTAVHVVVHNASEGPLVVTAAEIVLELVDGRRARAISAEELERMESPPSAVATPAVLVPMPPDAAAEVVPETETSRAAEILEGVKDAAKLAVLVPAWIAWESYFKGMALVLAGATLPIWGPFYFYRLFQRNAQHVEEEQRERQQRAVDTLLRRREPVLLTKHESASAILHFDVDPAAVGTAVLLVPFVDAKDQQLLVRLPLARQPGMQE